MTNADEREGGRSRARMPAVQRQPVTMTVAKALLMAPVQPYREGECALRVVSMRGRRPGVVRRVPLAVTVLAGQRYVCAPDRRRDWVVNLTAAGRCLVHGDIPPVARSVWVSGEAAARVIVAYLSASEHGQGGWPFAADASMEDVSAYLDRVAVFRLESGAA